MVAQFLNTSDEKKAELISGLKLIPNDWALTPVLGNKRPYREDWNHAVPMSQRQLIAVISDGDRIIGKDGKFHNIYPQGYGLRTGKWSRGILAIDADGDAAHEKLNQLGGLPQTVSFTSGKPGRCQYLVRVPEKYWSVISTKKINTGVKGSDGKNQLLELRWNGCQSVLPPSVHPETGSYKWVNSPEDCAIAESPIWIIEYFLNESTTTTNTPTTLVTDDVPLYQCLTLDDRDLIDRGVGSGSRDDNGAKLARNLIGTAARLTHLGYRFVDNARQLFDDYCARCSPPLSVLDAERIWKSALKSNPSASLTDDALNNCIKAWQKNSCLGISPNQERTFAQSASSPQLVVPHPKFAKQNLLSGDELLTEIDKLIDAHIVGAQLQAKLLDLAALAGRTLNEVSRLYFSREQDSEFIFERETATRQLPTLLEAQRAQLSPQQVLWGDGGKLAQLIQSTAVDMPVSPEALLTTLFPVAGSRIGTSSRLVINPKTNYTVTSIFWSCVVSKTGTLKSPAQKVIINPLNILEANSYKNWKQEQDDYKRQLKHSAKGDELPSEPKPRKRLIIQGSTTEARMKIHAENPRGLLYHRDEWVSFITARNKYRGGKGDDAQLDLSEFNGDALYKDVVDSDKCIFLEQSAISRTGNTQPEILKQFQSQGDFADYAGEFARWLYCLKENPLAFIDLFKEDDGIGKQLNNELSFLYQFLGNLPERDYFLNDDAKRIYQKYQHQLIEWLAVEEHPGLAATYPKLQTYLGRFALWLHLVNAVLAGESTPVQFINGRTMQAAVKCTEFYLAQARLMYALNSDQNTLAGNLLKIKDYIEKHPVGVSIRQIKQGIKALKKVPSALIEQDCQALLSSGLIQKVAKIYQSVIRKNVDPVGQMLSRGQHVTNIDIQELDKNVGPVDPLVTDFSNPPQLDGYLREVEKSSYIEETANNGQQFVETQPQQEVDHVDPPPTVGQQTVNTANENTDTSPSNLDNCLVDAVAKADANVFQVGDVVAAVDPYEIKFAWEGIVKEVSDNGQEIVVYWVQREGTACNPIEKHELSYLRLISSR